MSTWASLNIWLFTPEALTGLGVDHGIPVTLLSKGNGFLQGVIIGLLLDGSGVVIDDSPENVGLNVLVPIVRAGDMVFQSQTMVQVTLTGRQVLIGLAAVLDLADFNGVRKGHILAVAVGHVDADVSVCDIGTALPHLGQLLLETIDDLFPRLGEVRIDLIPGTGVGPHISLARAKGEIRALPRLGDNELRVLAQIHPVPVCHQVEDVQTIEMAVAIIGAGLQNVPVGTKQEAPTVDSKALGIVCIS